MKTANTTQILLKSIDIELKKLIQKDIEVYRMSQSKDKGNNQGNTKAA